MKDNAHDRIASGAFCPGCYAELLRTNVVRVDASASHTDCSRCGKASAVLLCCRYTMKGSEKRKRGLI